VRQTLDRRLFSHFQSELRESQGLAIEFQSKEGKRLFQACERLKKLLSTIGEASVTVENVAQDRDASISISRDAFERLCADERTRVVEMVRAAVASAGVTPESIASVEIVGGGTRIPFVQAAILEALSSSDPSLIGRMLDSTTAVAVGAAFCRDLIPAEDAGESPAASEELAQWIALESEMQARDADLAAIAHERNAIEAFVYEMRSKQHEAHGELIDAGKLDPLLEAAEDWIYSEESEFATLAQVHAKREEIETQVREACAAYFAAVSEAQRVFEAQLEAESEKAKAEQGEGEDHDTRRLKKPERMRLVAKNKEEGNELFRDGNYQHAAMRYVKALSHASKFFDLTSDDLEEVHALKLSLYLNLAQCYLKLESWSKAIANCNDALALDGKSVKALYRRAVAYEKEKDLERAQQDVKQALELAPQDKAVLKLDERLSLLAKRQLDREKKMWSKAFA
jgi:heat shock protein 4